MRRNTEVYLDDILKAWLWSTARSEKWRLPDWYNISDLVQDGYVCYCKCRDRYTLGPPKEGYQDLNTDSPSPAQRQHFMKLVQRSFYNHLVTLARKHPAHRENPVDCPVTDDSNALLESMLPPQPEEASVLLALVNAPAEIADALGRVLNDGLGEETFLRKRLHRHNGRLVRTRRALRETTAEYYERLFGDADLPEKAAAYLYS